ncbi:MAG: hypothetical protein JNM65_10935 [Verrucomicrobiaceae bacterium]|nr:hypothetical protein [Verrucomicrobiaceae bacterium]
MKTLIPQILILSLLLTLPLSAQAPAAAGAPREFKDLLKHIPSKDFLKLRGNSKSDAAMAMSKDITAKELRQESTFRMEVGKIEAWPFPEDGISGWRIRCQDETVKQGSLVITVSAWAYVRQDPDGVIPKLKIGKDVIVSGKISRADLTATDKPTLNIDLNASSIKVEK